MLNSYRQRVQLLLQDTAAVRALPSDLNTYINEARRQIALGSQIIRQPAQLTLTTGQQAYAFSSATYVPSPAAPTGLGSIILIRSARLQIPQAGSIRLQLRSWEWFETYYLSTATPTDNGQPKVMAQQLLGIGNGTIWLSPPPDQDYVLLLIPISIPIDLVDDSTAEALPQPWQDAVQFYAAHLAALSMGLGDIADRMWQHYQTFQNRGNRFVTGTRLPQTYPSFIDEQPQQSSSRSPRGSGGGGAA